MNPLSLIGLIPSLFQVGYGIYQNSQANKLNANNPMPQYQIPAGYQQNVNLAANEAQVGTPQSTTNYENQQNSRGLTTGINAAEKTGQGVNAISNLYGNFLGGESQISAVDAQQKQANEGQFMQANNALSNQQALQWNNNQNLPYLRNLNTINNLRNGSAQNIYGGISGAATSAASALSTPPTSTTQLATGTGSGAPTGGNFSQLGSLLGASGGGGGAWGAAGALLGG